MKTFLQLTALSILFGMGLFANAQQLDLSDRNLKPSAHPAKSTPVKKQSVVPQAQTPRSEYYVGQQQPLSASVSKVRYMPAEMFGQWTLISQLLNTDDPTQYSPSMSEIWILERQGDQLIISNPSTGGQASIAVEKVEGKTAFLSRELWQDRRHTILESFTIRVNGDLLTGQSMHKIRTIKNGQIVHETFGLYQIEAKRISQGRTQFRPGVEPDLQIEEPRRQ